MLYYWILLMKIKRNEKSNDVDGVFVYIRGKEKFEQ